MEVAPLFNLSPAWRVMALGAVVALLPTLWVVWRNRTPARFLLALATITVFLTLDLVVLGAFTRLTDSGLGCPDWPGCYGHGSPVGASLSIDQAQVAMPTGPVTQSKAWIEMLHRYLATGIGALTLLLTVLHVRAHHRLRPGAPTWHWSLGAFLWTCVQGAFGALTVTMKLFPAIVTLHLLGGVVLLALLTVLATRLAQAQRGLRLEPVSPRWRLRFWLVLALLLVQIALGGWVSSNYAVLACTEFPMCQGSWWPTMDFGQAFSVWHGLGRTADGAFVNFEALTAIHVVHRLFAGVVLLTLGALIVRLWTVIALRIQTIWLGLLTLLQVLTGLSNVVLGWPIAGAVLHTGGAAALVMVVVWILCTTRVFRQRARS